MENESTGTDPYAAVLADLRAQRDKIDQAIGLLENLRGGGSAATPAPRVTPNGGTHGGVGPGDFLGMSIVDAAKQVLALRRRQLGNADILADLKQGGLVLKSAEPLNTVGSILNRRFKEVGDIVRVDRGTWGLKEWYPNRTFRPAVKGGDTPINNESSAQEASPVGDEAAFDDVPDEIPGFTPRPPPQPRERFVADLDDEIPF